MTGYVLLVEDDPDDQVLIRKSLRDSRLLNRVVVCSDGVEALECLATAEELPQLVLLDINLPRMNGHELLRRVRAQERTRLLPVVILTSSREERDVREGYEAGCNSYVQKPVEFTELAEAVRQLGLYWMLLSHAPPQ